MNKVIVRTFGEGLMIKPDRKNGKAHFMRTAQLTGARLDRSFVRGNLVHEAYEDLAPTHPVLLKRLIPLTRHGDCWIADDGTEVTDYEFAVVYMHGDKILAYKEW